MTAIDKIRAKFWDQMPVRSTRLGALIEETRRGERGSAEALSSLIHTAKGEAQLLGLEPCAGLLELSDRLVKTTKSGAYAPTLDALETLPGALVELAKEPTGGAATRTALASIERALGANGVDRA